MRQLKNLSDQELVERLICNDEKVINYFFNEKCKLILGFIIKDIFSYRVEKNELANELYLYLREDNWCRIRKFYFRSTLTTWMSIVAVRFFQNKRNELIGNGTSSALINKVEPGDDPIEKIIAEMDVDILLHMMPNKRYRNIIKSLIIDDCEPQQVADQMGITVDNLYNLRRRALQQLGKIINKRGKLC